METHEESVSDISRILPDIELGHNIVGIVQVGKEADDLGNELFGIGIGGRVQANRSSSRRPDTPLA